jgi:tetratricopeptide (TPR) repeat protein
MLPVDPKVWTIVSPLLDRALDLERASREQFVADIANSDPEAAAALSRLLAVHDQLSTSDFLDGEQLRGAWTGMAGVAIGPYTLESPLGAGGAGVVWKARRSDGHFEGAVAVKLLQLSTLTPASAARFTREGTLLARLSHPNVAHLRDAGVTAAGQPYLVLELIDGVRIDHYATQQDLDTPARVRLLLQVCDAVAHAHAHLVVHRDLKPSNILVDPDGVVKLLDFGVASLLADDHPASARAGAHGFTPDYAAPEQLMGGVVTTATDVFALGKLLTILLGGTPLRGDLAAITIKATEASPSDRYASVTALADDLRRYLRHEPIAAQRGALLYRGAKFVRRHRWPVLTGAAAAIILLAGVAEINRQRVMAERRFQQLHQLSNRVFDLDTAIRRLPGATAARQSLVTLSLEYLETLTRDAADDVGLMGNLVDGYVKVALIQGVPTNLNLGDLAAAEHNLAKADALVEQILRRRPGDGAALVRAAEIAHDRMIVADSEGRNADALVFVNQTVERMERVLRDPVLAAAQVDRTIVLYGNVATACVNLHRSDDGVRYARRTLEISRKAGTPDRIMAGLSILANALRVQGELESALAAIREARDLAARRPASDPEQAMFSRYPLLLREGLIMGEDRGVSLDRPADAIAPLREAFDLTERVATLDPRDFTSRSRVGTSGRELGDILRWTAPQDAVAVYDVAIGRLREVPNNIKARRDEALALAGSSYALRSLGRIDQAGERVDRALAILATTKDYPADVVPIEGEAAVVVRAAVDHLDARGQRDSAIRELESLIAKVRLTHPDAASDLQHAYSLSRLYEDAARLRRLSGDADTAARWEGEALGIWAGWEARRPGSSFVQKQRPRIERLRTQPH